MKATKIVKGLLKMRKKLHELLKGFKMALLLLMAECISKNIHFFLHEMKRYETQ